MTLSMVEVKEFTEYLRVEKRYSDHTVRAYHDDLMQFSDFLQRQSDRKALLFIQQTDIRNWIIDLVEEGSKPRTLRRKTASLKAFFHYFMRNNVIKTNPAEGIILPKLEKTLPGFIKESSINDLFSQNLFSNDFEGKRDQFVLELFYATGMRLSELVNIKFSDFDLSRGDVKILGKRNKERIVPLTHNIIRLFKEYTDSVSEQFGKLSVEYLILTDKGEKAYPRMVQRLVEKYLSMATTLEKRSPHMIRHTFATHMLNNGADLNAVKELLGHANLAATEIYTHNTYEKLKAIYKQAHPRA
jgi:integrase/recombinase XerC